MEDGDALLVLAEEEEQDSSLAPVVVEDLVLVQLALEGAEEAEGVLPRMVVVVGLVQTGQDQQEAEKLVVLMEMLIYFH